MITPDEETGRLALNMGLSAGRFQKDIALAAGKSEQTANAEGVIAGIAMLFIALASDEELEAAQAARAEKEAQAGEG